MLVKRLGRLLGLLILAVIVQATLVGPASAGHNCYRPPYHCFFIYGTAEEVPSTSNRVPSELPNTILVENNKQSFSKKLEDAVLVVYTYTGGSKKVRVKLADDAKEFFKRYYQEQIKRQGWMQVRVNLEKPEEIPELLDFFPADREIAHPNIPPDKALDKYIKEFEHKFPKDKQMP